MKKNVIIRFFTKPYVYAIIFSIVLVACMTYSLLDVFVIPHYISAEVTNSDSSTSLTSSGNSNSNTSNVTANTGTVTTTTSSYEDDNIKITITTTVECDTTVYIADIQVSSPEYLQTALANNSYGTNITATTSSTAESVNAILAINGDYYGVQEKNCRCTICNKNGSIGSSADKRPEGMREDDNCETESQKCN